MLELHLLQTERVLPGNRTVDLATWVEGVGEGEAPLHQDNTLAILTMDNMDKPLTATLPSLGNPLDQAALVDRLVTRDNASPRARPFLRPGAQLQL